MKKMLLLAAVVGVAFTSCVNEEFNEGTSKQEVMRFDVPVLSKTKANVLGEIEKTTYPTDEDFMVFCKAYKGAFSTWENAENINYFDAAGEVASNNSNVGTGTGSSYWATVTEHYWPETEYNLAFAAYSPAELTTAPTLIEQNNQGLHIEGFQTEKNSNKQYDLMYALRKIDMNKNKWAGSAVTLKFNHALSSIVFSSWKSDDKADYNITKIVVAGKFCQKADFLQGAGTGDVDHATNDEKCNASWKNHVTVTDTIQYHPNFTEFNVPVEAPTQFTKGASALLLIPQVIPDDATVTIYYTKTTNAGTADEVVLNTSATIPLKEFAYTDEANVSHNITTWEIGKRYIYRIQFGKNERIYFEPSVTDWVTESTLIYTIK